MDRMTTGVFKKPHRKFSEMSALFKSSFFVSLSGFLEERSFFQNFHIRLAAYCGN